MKRSVLRSSGIAAALVVAIFGPFNSLVAVAQSPPAFEATFDTAGDFYNRFDYGYSGPNPWDWGNGSGQGAVMHAHGDHDMNCGPPTSQRDVAFGGNKKALNFSQVFWWCAPKGPTSGHVMTGVDTISYNVAWFSPKSLFTKVSKVCWDINETQLSRRKWTQVMFVGAADAVAYPSNRGSGGYDLGYTNPEFRPGVGPNTETAPSHGDLAGASIGVNGVFSWFQHDTEWTATEQGSPLFGVTDKAARYQHCISQEAPGVIRFTQQRPGGTSQSLTVPGTIPQGPVRVVFEDDNYDPPKDDHYNANNVTWHWDNIRIEASAATASAAAPSVAKAATTELAAAATRSPSVAALPAAGSPEPRPAQFGATAAAANVAGLALTLGGLVLVLLLGPIRASRGRSRLASEPTTGEE